MSEFWIVTPRDRLSLKPPPAGAMLNRSVFPPVTFRPSTFRLSEKFVSTPSIPAFSTVTFRMVAPELPMNSPIVAESEMITFSRVALVFSRVTVPISGLEVEYRRIPIPRTVMPFGPELQRPGGVSGAHGLAGGVGADDECASGVVDPEGARDHLGTGLHLTEFGVVHIGLVRVRRHRVARVHELPVRGREVRQLPW